MNISKKIISSILIILVFFSLLIPNTSQASIFDDDEDEAQSEIEETIDNDDGGLFEKIIAKLIGGIAATIFDLTTNEDFGMGFKNYDELIFAKDATVISPFTDEQWDSMMDWYKIMSSIAGSIILIAVVVVAYKMIISGYSAEHRTEAKDSIMRLFFGAVAIVFAPLFVKFLLFLNNNLVHMIVGYANGSLDELLGNGVVTNIQTGNAIATAIVIALFAYLFFKLNVKFIIRQFTIWRLKMNKKQQELTIGTKYGCFTIIGDNNSYPKEPITDPVVEANLKRQIDIKQKIKNGELPKDFKMQEYYICKCRCGKEYFLWKEVLLARKLKYCSENCYTDVEYDKSKNYDTNYLNTIHESLDILECIDENYEYYSYIEKTRRNRIKHIKIDKKYKCVCYLCNKEHIFSALDFEIRNDNYGRNATKGYYSNAYCDCHKISSFQWRTIKIFEENNIKYKVEISFPDLMKNSNLLRYDFAIFDSNGCIKCLIECQGIQHYQPVKEFGGDPQFENQMENDKLKKNYAKRNNIPLIEIPYTCNTYEKELEFLKEQIGI